MREIKFRGREYQYQGRWCCGSLVQKHLPDRVICMIFEEALVDNKHLVDPATVGQCTGLRDSDGREIYEGDIVRTDDWSTPSYIRWDVVTASFVVDRWSVNLAHVSQIKVIGNIHDNPELLEARA